MSYQKRRCITPSPPPSLLALVSEATCRFMFKGWLTWQEFATRNTGGVQEIDGTKLMDELAKRGGQKKGCCGDDIVDMLTKIRFLHMSRLLLEGKKSQAEKDFFRPLDKHEKLKSFVDTMRCYPKAINVQLLGRRVIHRLATRRSDWIMIWKAGVLEVFLQNLQNYPDNKDIHESSIRFICILIQTVGDEPRKQVLQGGGVELIIVSMRRFKHDTQIQHIACQAMYKLRFSQEAKSLLLLHDGAQAIVCSIETHADDVPLVSSWLKALVLIHEGGTIPQDDNFIPLILKMMSIHQDGVDIQEVCLRLLLKATPAQTEVLATTDSICLVLYPMKKFRGYSEVQCPACCLLCKILHHTLPTGNNNACNDICSMGGIEYLLNALEIRGKYSYQISVFVNFFLMQLRNEWELHNSDAVQAFGGSRLVPNNRFVQVRVHVDNQNRLN